VTDPEVPADWEVSLPGEHNRKNAAFALAALRFMGIADAVTRGVFKKFHALPGRLEPLGEKNGIEFYNDSNSTTPEATLAAIDALTGMHRPIVLIAGGSDKELDFSKFVPKVKDAVKALVLFNGSGSEKMKALLPAGFHYGTASSMDEAFSAAVAAAAPGDVILLSPGATSFGIFKNEYDRGDRFRAAFEKLK
jgi:UDP-N-acetylmuramoylalanine--D-glutamate ligase